MVEEIVGTNTVRSIGLVQQKLGAGFRATITLANARRDQQLDAEAVALNLEAARRTAIGVLPVSQDAKPKISRTSEYGADRLNLLLVALSVACHLWLCGQMLKHVRLYVKRQTLIVGAESLRKDSEGIAKIVASKLPGVLNDVENAVRKLGRPRLVVNETMLGRVDGLGMDMVMFKSSLRLKLAKVIVINQNTASYGKQLTEPYQRVMSFITSMGLRMTTALKTWRSWLAQNTTIAMRNMTSGFGNLKLRTANSGAS